MNGVNLSVAICTCNGALYIAEQLNSIIHQELCVDEIIVSDDCSDDMTVAIAERILEKCGIAYTIIENSTRLGVTKNFEQAIRCCSGNIILTSDQDDLWKPEKTKIILKCFAADPDCVMVFSDADVIDGCGNRICNSLYEKDGFMQAGDKDRDYVDKILRLGYTVYGCTMAFRKDFADKITPFFESEANHDAWIMCCAGMHGNVRYIPETLISYRIHGSNVVGSLTGNPKWERIIANRDRYEQHFAIHKLRELRVELLEEALKRNSIKNFYTTECRKCVVFYHGLLQAKGKRIPGIWFLFRSLLTGRYIYRFCDRGVKLSPSFMLKQFVCDIMFIIKWRN